jgi:hypothetical protein
LFNQQKQTIDKVQLKTFALGSWKLSPLAFSFSQLEKSLWLAKMESSRVKLKREREKQKWLMRRNKKVVETFFFATTTSLGLLHIVVLCFYRRVVNDSENFSVWNTNTIVDEGHWIWKSLSGVKLFSQWDLMSRRIERKSCSLGKCGKIRHGNRAFSDFFFQNTDFGGFLKAHSREQQPLKLRHKLDYTIKTCFEKL